MALFGYPQAEENDAERAVRAALAIQRGLGELGELSARDTRSGEPELAVRIGIDAGPVVVEPGGEVYGETPNIAARVQALAARARSWSPRASRVRWPACSSRRIAARMR
jgi:class 3 adenylate cyclase